MRNVTMKKTIIFFLLVIASALCHSMETSQPAASLDLVMRDPKIAWHITEKICRNHKRRPENCKHDIRALYQTNKFLHDYYSNEKTMQRIVDKGERIYYSGQYRTVARQLGCHTITQKMKHFCHIAYNYLEFTEKDLQDPWYFSINLSPWDDQSLLYLLIKLHQFEQADTIITHAEKIDFGWHSNNYLLKLISESRTQYRDDTDKCSDFLRITERLLREKNMPADGTFLPLTALMDASQSDDKPFAHLLLGYGANPYKRRGNYSFEKNALEMEKGEPKGWLKHMVKSNNLFKYWSFKNYTDTILPQEIMSLIVLTIQQLHYHYDTQKYRLFDNSIKKRSTIKKELYTQVSCDLMENDGKNIHGVVEYIPGNNRVYRVNLNPLLKNHTEYNDLLKKPLRLLQKGFRPNFREKNTEYTPLISAVNNGDKEFAKFLLEYGADPYIKICNHSTKKMETAFNPKTTPTWFKKIVEYIPKYLLLKNYTAQDSTMLPQEIALLIIQMYIDLQEA